jgi:hypothetical protein
MRRAQAFGGSSPSASVVTWWLLTKSAASTYACGVFSCVRGLSVCFWNSARSEIPDRLSPFAPWRRSGGESVLCYPAGAVGHTLYAVDHERSVGCRHDQVRVRTTPFPVWWIRLGGRGQARPIAQASYIPIRLPNSDELSTTKPPSTNTTPSGSATR